MNDDRLDHVDLLARRAASDLETATTTDPGLGLAGLHAGHARHRSHTRVATAVVLLAALSTGWFGRGMVTGDRTAPAVSPTPPVTTPSLGVLHGGPWARLCQADNVTCLGHRTYRLELAAPVRWHLPEGSEVANGGPTTDYVETYWTHRGNRAGVSVLENVRAAATGPVPGPAPGVSATASGFVHWLAARPFLVSSEPRRMTLAGHQDWQTRVRLRGGEPPGPGACTNGFACYPVTTNGPAITGIWDDMVADYTAVDLPGHGTAVVWSWAFGHDTAALARNQVLVDGISWPGL
jgi:hypothetical protein